MYKCTCSNVHFGLILQKKKKSVSDPKINKNIFKILFTNSCYTDMPRAYNSDFFLLSNRITRLSPQVEQSGRIWSQSQRGLE